jgi:hypothetical protein
MSATQRSVREGAAADDLRLTRLLSDRPEALASLSLMLATGGDGRIWPDPITGRNRYGTRTTPAIDEIVFSSTTASNVSVAGFAAADRELKRLISTAPGAAIDPDQWFADVRRDVALQLGHTDTEVVLAASGTDVEVLALCFVSGMSKRPLTNIYVAPDETGNGVPLAAAGRHFSNLTAQGSSVEPGGPIEGLSPDRIDVRTIAIRNDKGEQRRLQEIDADLAAAVEQELKRGRDVLVHVLDTSKTGLPGVTRQVARDVVAAASGRVRVIIDACQLRCSISQIRQDLNDGFLVAVTGSKFAAGPPFAGALLLPAAVAEEIASCADLPIGLADYTAAQDWPEALRERSGFAFKSEMNIGLSLRWIAALANFAPCALVSEPQRPLINARFADLVGTRARDVPGIMIHSDDDSDHLVSSGIIPLTVLKNTGAFATLAEAQTTQAALRNPEGGPICHIGQAVRVGPRTVLRVAASALDIAGVGTRMAAGQSLDEAFKPVEADLDVLFSKWSKIDRQPRDA